jgi:pyrimidine-specific ribonucleoside hydrolase
MASGTRAGFVSAQSLLTALGLAAVLLILAAVEPASPAVAAARPVSVVVDTDLGSDDVLALVFLTGRRDVELRAVTVSGTGLARCPGGARRAARILRALGRPSVPVACGRQDPLAGFNAFPVEWRDGAARLGASLPASPGQLSRLAAADLLADAVRRSAGPDILLTLGPLTNVADALRRHPSLRDGIARIVTMGGAVDVPGNIGPAHEHAEYNLWVDPRAAREVLTSGIPVTYVPLDATNDVPVNPLLAREIARRPGRAVAVARQAQAGLFPGSFYWDPLAAATLVDPAVVATRRMRLVVRETADSWNGSLRRAANGTPALVATSARRARFELLLLRGVTRDGNARIALPSPAVTIDGGVGTCAVAASVSKPGSGWLYVRNRTKAQLGGVLVRLLDGKTIADLQEALRTLKPKPGDPPPAWIAVTAFAAAPAGQDAWVESKLTAGTYAAVCVSGAGVFRTAPTTFDLG